MADARNSVNKKRRPPAKTEQGRENQLINLAIDLAEKQLSEGTASAAVISHFLKLATEKENLERQKLIRETRLLEKKENDHDTNQRMEALYSEALNAMRSYSGVEVQSDDEDF